MLTIYPIAASGVLFSGKFRTESLRPVRGHFGTFGSAVALHCALDTRQYAVYLYSISGAGGGLMLRAFDLCRDISYCSILFSNWGTA